MARWPLVSFRAARGRPPVAGTAVLERRAGERLGPCGGNVRRWQPRGLLVAMGNASYDVWLRVRSQGQWLPAQRVAATDRFEAHPSLAFGGEGTLWIAYEEGQRGWGMDSHKAGLRSGAMFACAAAPRTARSVERLGGQVARLQHERRGLFWMWYTVTTYTVPAPMWDRSVAEAKISNRSNAAGNALESENRSTCYYACAT